MRRLVQCGSLLLLLLAFIVPTFAGDETKKKDVGDETKKKDVGDDKKTDTKKGGETETKKKKEKFVYGAKYVGKVTQLDANSATKDFTLHITGKVQELDQGAQNQLLQQQQQLQNQTIQWQNHQRAAFQATNAQARQNAVNQMNQSQQQIALTLTQIAQTQGRLYKSKDVAKDVKFRVAEKCIFRILAPEPEYDDKGNPVEFTKADKERLKGKLKDYVPGYQAEADALRTNVMVAVYTPKIDPSAKKDAKKKMDDDDVVLPPDRLEVILVIIDNGVKAAPK